MPDSTCTYDGLEGPCPRPISNPEMGLCSKHIRRWRKHGTTEVIRPFGKYPDEEVTYGSMHHRVRRLKGSAKHCVCVDCGEPAVEWSYEGGDPNERIGPNQHGTLMAYSTDPSYYRPRCVSCHRHHDGLNHRDKPYPNATLTLEQVLEIFTSTESHSAISRRLGVGVRAVQHVRRRESWQHVTDELPTVKYKHGNSAV
jgi:hypothetical protein